MKSFFFITLLMAVVSIESCMTTKKIISKSSSCPAAVQDIDGNVYHTVKIGNQCWMKESLRVTHFRDGSVVPEVEDSTAWVNMTRSKSTSPACCKPDTIIANGYLYNWYAVNDPRQLCPAGWYVASDTDWHTLALTLDSNAAWQDVESKTAGGELMAVSKLWSPTQSSIDLTPNTGANDSSGFSALPTFIRSSYGDYYTIYCYSSFWTSTEREDLSGGWTREVGCRNVAIGRMEPEAEPHDGFAVRCIKGKPHK